MDGEPTPVEEPACAILALLEESLHGTSQVMDDHALRGPACDGRAMQRQVRPESFASVRLILPW